MRACVLMLVRGCLRLSPTVKRCGLLGRTLRMSFGAWKRRWLLVALKTQTPRCNGSSENVNSKYNARP